MHKARHGGLRQRKGLVPLGVCMEPGGVRKTLMQGFINWPLTMTNASFPTCPYHTHAGTGKDVVFTGSGLLIESICQYHASGFSPSVDKTFGTDLPSQRMTPLPASAAASPWPSTEAATL